MSVVYKRVTLDVVVREDEREVLVQALNNAMDHLEETQQVTVFDSSIRESETAEPENAAEIAGGN